ncbi:Phosphoadenosine phosphosulfate reductase [Sphaceloma murrayae]|uniref:phosphoadenylyl-sulfate reductase (thioredoxin) n=1 Tax=Sphaceloma murrayae TaxID=2082308 RepID=A0A2K1QWS3_9PEZI|nr:Phosphoadenosine phosphosulfate reductase [Sphaceloma murrayae]
MAPRRYSHSSDRDAESGYASGSSTASLPELYFSRPHLKFLNQQLSKLEPQDILKWCITSLPRLYQTTAFGLTGLAINDMLSKLDGPIKPDIDLIFLDTLHHFKETLELVDRVKRRYPHLVVHVYKPQGCDTVDDFNNKHGEKLWESNEELYDYIAKVEPGQRAYAELQVAAVITGRRKSQGGKRGEMDIIEVDDTGMVKINPLANWTFGQVEEYIKEHDVPTNVLLDRGYRSVGDWHSTQPVTEGEDERAGRWKGRSKTECGIHNKKSRYAMFLQEQEQKRQDELSRALQDGLSIEAA